MANQYVSAIVIHQAKTVSDWGSQIIPQAQVVIELGETPADYKMKIGDGSTAYPSLPYIGGGFIAGSLQAVLIAGNQANGEMVLTDGTSTTTPGSGTYLMLMEKDNITFQKNVSSAWANVINIISNEGSGPALIQLLRNPGAGSQAFYADNSGNCYVASVANRDRVGMISQDESAGHTFFYLAFNPSGGGGTAKILGDNLTGDRSLQLPDASGTLALAGSYSTPSLDEVLAVGSSTDRAISITDSSTLVSSGLSGDGLTVTNSDGSQHTYYNLNSIEMKTYQTFGGSKTNTLVPTATTANRTWTLPDASGTLALAGSYSTPSLDEVLAVGSSTDRAISITDSSTLVSSGLSGDGLTVTNSDGSQHTYYNLNSIEMKTYQTFGGSKTNTLVPTATTANRTWTLPDASGTICVTAGCIAVSETFSGTITVVTITHTMPFTPTSIQVCAANATAANFMAYGYYIDTITSTTFNLNFPSGAEDTCNFMFTFNA